MPKVNNKNNNLNLEEKLIKIETIIDELDKNDLALEELIVNYEAGVNLANSVRNELLVMEQKIIEINKSIISDNSIT